MNQPRALFAVLLCNAFEYYQHTLYGFFALTLAANFFDAENLSFSILASLATFAVGFLANPFGGLIFGYIGDRFGRKKTLLLSIVLSSCPTLLIGFLPLYQDVGLISSILVILCRFVQGFSVGGQAYSRIIYVVEEATKKRANLVCGLLASSSLLGAMLGTVMGALCVRAGVPDWAWRIPFLLGGFLGLISYLIMRHVDETYAYQEAQNNNRLVENPIRYVVTHHFNNFICVIGIVAATLIPFYTLSVFAIHSLFEEKFGFSSSQIMVITTLFLSAWACLLPLMALLADRKDSFYLMKWASLALMIAALPLFWIMNIFPTIAVCLIVLVILSALSAAYVAPSGAFMTNLFPVTSRCSGLSVAAGIGSALFGGTAPLVAAFLVNTTGSCSSLAVFIALSSLLGFVALSRAQPFLDLKKEAPLYPVNQNNLIVTLNQQGYMIPNLHSYSQAFVDFAAQAPGPVLDIGAAYGVATLPALEVGACVIANDIDDRHLKILEKRVPDSCHKRLTLCLGKIPGEVTFPENSLSAVLASGVLHFLSGDELIEAITLIFKWLKPSGKFFFATSTPYAKLYHSFLPLYLERKKAHMPWPGLIENTSTYIPHMAHEIPQTINLLDLDIVADLLLKAGFVIEKMGFFEDEKTENGRIGADEGLGVIAVKPPNN